MSSREMAAKRELEAGQLEDSEIWTAIVAKFVLMEVDLNNRVEMLMQAVGGDKQIVEHALKACVKNELISETQAHEMLSAIS